MQSGGSPMQSGGSPIRSGGVAGVVQGDQVSFGVASGERLDDLGDRKPKRKRLW